MWQYFIRSALLTLLDQLFEEAHYPRDLSRAWIVICLDQTEAALKESFDVVASLLARLYGCIQRDKTVNQKLDCLTRDRLDFTLKYNPPDDFEVLKLGWITKDQKVLLVFLFIVSFIFVGSRARVLWVIPQIVVEVVPA